MNRGIAALVAAALLAACEPAPEEPVEPPEAAPETEIQVDEADRQALADAWQEEATPALRRLRAASEGFHDLVGALLNDPAEQRLETARAAWHELYGHWNRAMVVLAARDLDADRERFLRVDPLPILPGYVDGLAAWPESGLIHDPTIALERETLLEQQELTAAGEITTGFQVIHFLLFGEPERERTAAEFDAGDDNGEASLAKQRRRQYLAVTTELLRQDLEALARQEDDAPSATALLAGLDFAMERHGELEALEGATDPAEGLYLAADARATAREPLFAAVNYWLSGDGHAPLTRVLEQTDAEAAALASEHGEDWTKQEGM